MCIFAPQVYVLIVSHVLYGFHWGFHGMINKRVCQNFHQWENCSVKTRLDSQTFFTLEQLIASSGLLTRNARWLIGVWSRIWQQKRYTVRAPIVSCSLYIFYPIFQCCLPYALHYNPQFVYFLTTFWSPKKVFQGSFFLKFCPYEWLVFKSFI